MNITTNFSIREFASPDTDLIPVPVIENIITVAHQLQILRDTLQVTLQPSEEIPIHVNSGFRTAEHNASLKNASPTSQHLQGKAADIWVPGVTPLELYNIIRVLMNERRMLLGGLGLYDTFVHYDIRGVRAIWDFRTKHG